VGGRSWAPDATRRGAGQQRGRACPGPAPPPASPAPTIGGGGAVEQLVQALDGVPVRLGGGDHGVARAGRARAAQGATPHAGRAVRCPAAARPRCRSSRPHAGQRCYQLSLMRAEAGHGRAGSRAPRRNSNWCRALLQPTTPAARWPPRPEKLVWCRCNERRRRAGGGGQRARNFLPRTLGTSRACRVLEGAQRGF